MPKAIAILDDFQVYCTGKDKFDQQKYGYLLPADSESLERVRSLIDMFPQHQGKYPLVRRSEAKDGQIYHFIKVKHEVARLQDLPTEKKLLSLRAYVLPYEYQGNRGLRLVCFDKPRVIEREAEELTKESVSSEDAVAL